MPKPGESEEAALKRERLERFAKEHGFASTKAWADKAKVSEGMLRNYRDRPGATMRGATLKALANAAGAEEADLLNAISGKNEIKKMPANLESQPERHESVLYPGATADIGQHIRHVPLSAGLRNLPILGHAKGGDEAYFIDNGVMAGMTYRPNLLESVGEAYAIEIWDTSMEPAFKHGCLAFVNPRKQIAPDDDVVVQLIDGQALIKQYVRRTDGHLVLRQHNPPKDIKIARNEVRSIHLIVDATRVRT